MTELSIIVILSIRLSVLHLDILSSIASIIWFECTKFFPEGNFVSEATRSLYATPLLGSKLASAAQLSETSTYFRG